MFPFLKRNRRLESKQVNGALVVVFPEAVIGEERVREIGLQLVRFADAAASSEVALLLDFAGVHGMCSAMIGQLVLLNKYCRQRKIDLRTRGLSPDLLPPFPPFGGGDAA